MVDAFVCRGGQLLMTTSGARHAAERSIPGVPRGAVVIIGGGCWANAARGF